MMEILWLAFSLKAGGIMDRIVTVIPACGQRPAFWGAMVLLENSLLRFAAETVSGGWRDAGEIVCDML